ncbi:hypothetical protein ACFL08_05240, partial [Patescibacteria group bacterium]
SSGTEKDVLVCFTRCRVMQKAYLVNNVCKPEVLDSMVSSGKLLMRTHRDYGVSEDEYTLAIKGFPAVTNSGYVARLERTLAHRMEELHELEECRKSRESSRRHSSSVEIIRELKERNERLMFQGFLRQVEDEELASKLIDSGTLSITHFHNSDITLQKALNKIRGR